MAVNNSHMFSPKSRICNPSEICNPFSLRSRTRGLRRVLITGYAVLKMVVRSTTSTKTDPTSANIGTIGRPGWIKVLLVPLTRHRKGVDIFNSHSGIWHLHHAWLARYHRPPNTDCDPRGCVGVWQCKKPRLSSLICLH